MVKATVYSVDSMHKKRPKKRRGCLLSFVFMIILVMLSFFLYQRWQILVQAKSESKIESHLTYESDVQNFWQRNILFVGIDYPDASQINGKVPTVVTLIQSDVDAYEVIRLSLEQIPQLGQPLSSNPFDDASYLEEIGQQVKDITKKEIHHTLIVDFDKLHNFREQIEDNQYVFSDDLLMDKTKIASKTPITLSSRQVQYVLNNEHKLNDVSMRRQMEVYYFDLHRLNQSLFSQESRLYSQNFFGALSTNIPDNYWMIQVGADLLNNHQLKWMKQN